jgi:hypothetical protein
MPFDGSWSQNLKLRLAPGFELIDALPDSHGSISVMKGDEHADGST